MGNIRFGTFTPEAAAQEKEMLDAIAPSTKYFKPVEGQNVIRMLPPLQGFSTPWATGYQHFIKLPWLEKQDSAMCPRVMAKLPCPVCALASKLAASRDAAHHKIAQELEPKFVAVAAVIDRAHPEAGIQTWSFGKGLYKELTGLRQDTVAGGDFCDPERGFDISLHRTGTGIDTRYKLQLARNPSAIADEDTLDFWFEAFPDFRTPLETILPSDEIVAKLGRVPQITTTIEASRPTAPSLPARAGAPRAPLGTARFQPSAPAPAGRVPARTAQAMVDDFEDPDLA